MYEGSGAKSVDHTISPRNQGLGQFAFVTISFTPWL
jgi:hypothetical protein